jgi:pyruvate,orthophosphate dikinase
MQWADKLPHGLKVRTNADSPEDSVKAIEMGAEGIGLCRTEHMFFSTRERAACDPGNDRRRQSRRARKEALDKLLPYQREDFIGIFKAMDGQAGDRASA